MLAIFGGIAIAIVGIIMGGRKKELQHKERIVAMEKGIEVPPLEQQKEKCARPHHAANRTGGLVLVGFGVAITIALWGTAGLQGGVWGLLPLGIGAGLLVSSHLEKGERERNDGGPERTS